MNRILIAAIVFVTGLTWAAITCVKGFPTDWFGALSPFASAITAAAAAAVAYEHLLWRSRPLWMWLNDRPDLRGVWEVSIASTYLDPETNKQIKPVRGFMCVRQTAHRLSMTLYTPESVSFTVAHSVRHVDGLYEVAIIYRNEPDLALQDAKSRPHFGSFVVRSSGHYPRSLSGPYWTDRKTNGTITFVRRVKGVANSFDEGVGLLGP